MPTLRPSERLALIASRSLRSRASTVSGSACAAHWNGVCGLGTKPPIDTVQRMSLWPAASRPARMTSWAISAISSTSSSVSVGRPHMKYSFTWRQPCAYAAETVRIRSSLLTILLITRRSRSEPPSGAKVSPERRPLRRELVGEVDVERVDAGRRQRQADPVVLVAVGQLLGHRADLGVVGGRQRQQPDLLEAGRAQPLLDHRADACRSSVRAPGRVIMPGLAEPAAARAAAEDLDRHPLVHRLGERDERGLRVRPLVEVHDGVLGDPLGHAGAVRAHRLDARRRRR